MLHLYARSNSVSLAAIRGGARDTTGDFKIRKMLEGIRRSRPAVPDKCRHNTIKMLKGLVIAFAKLCGSDFEIHFFRAVVHVMFWVFFLRVCEILVASKNSDPPRLYFGGIFLWQILSVLLCSGGPKMTSGLGV